MQLTAIFHGCKNDKFQSKSFDYFHIFAQNIDRGYTLEPPQSGRSNEYPRYMFKSISFSGLMDAQHVISFCLFKRILRLRRVFQDQ